MLSIPYTLVIEATADPDFFSFYSPELEGFTGVGHSVEDCLYRAKWGIRDHVALLKSTGRPVPAHNPDATITIRNEKPQRRTPSKRDGKPAPAKRRRSLVQ